MNFNSIKIKKASLIMTVMLVATVIYAQPGGGGGQSLGGSPSSGTGAPIDGGASVFLAAVAAYSHRKLKERKESQNSSDKI